MNARRIGDVRTHITMRALIACVGLACTSLGCATSTSSNLPPRSFSATASVREEIVQMGQEATTSAGNRVTIFSYVVGVSGARSPGRGMMFSAADVRACAGPHAQQQTGVSRSQFAVETPDRTGWASVDPVKTPALAGTVLKPDQCVRGWITFRVPTAAKARYVVLLSSNIVKWQIP